MANGSKSKRAWDSAIVALLEAPSVPAAAKLAGIPERTLYRWISREDFQDEYQEARRLVVQQALARLQAVMCQAVNALRDVLVNEEAPPSSRVSAARAVLELGIKATEIEDLERRVNALEVAASEKGGGL